MGTEEASAKVMRTVRGILYADDAGTVSRLRLSWTKVNVIKCGVCAAVFGLKVSETMHMAEPHTAARTQRITAADREYAQSNGCVYLGGIVTEHAELLIKIKRRSRLAINRFRNIARGSTTVTGRHSRSKFWRLKANVLETMLYGHVALFPNANHCSKLWVLPAALYRPKRIHTAFCRMRAPSPRPSARAWACRFEDGPCSSQGSFCDGLAAGCPSCDVKAAGG